MPATADKEQHAQAKQDEITARGIGMTVKTTEDAGVFLGYSWARLPDHNKTKSFTAGFERYFASKTGTKIKPIVAPSLGLNHTSLPFDLSVTSLMPGAAVGLMGPISKTGRMVTCFGVTVLMPISSSDGLDTKTTTTAYLTSTLAFRLTSKMILGVGGTYSDSNAEDSEGVFEFKIGLMFANPADR